MEVIVRTPYGDADPRAGDTAIRGMPAVRRVLPHFLSSCGLYPPIPSRSRPRRTEVQLQRQAGWLYFAWLRAMRVRVRLRVPGTHVHLLRVIISRRRNCLAGGIARIPFLGYLAHCP